jgi:uncharacterized protein (DUF302 family)
MTIITTLLVLAMTAVPTAPEGADVLASSHGATETIDRLAAIVEAHGGRVFARIDFSADAKKAGLELRPEVMLIFGNPKQGTPLLQAAPSVGLDLPLKALAWTDEVGATWVAFDTAEYITRRHGVPASLQANISGARTLIEQATH